jgi:hypothetical protein
MTARPYDPVVCSQRQGNVYLEGQWPSRIGVSFDLANEHTAFLRWLEGDQTLTITFANGTATYSKVGDEGGVWVGELVASGEVPS